MATAACQWHGEEPADARRGQTPEKLRERQRLALPVVAAVAGMAVAVAIYLAFNLGSSSAQG
jgi:Na+/H+ antiporter NhaA